MITDIALRNALLALFTASAVTACGEPEIEEPLVRTDLRAMLGVADADPIAVTVSPDGSEQFVFDRSSGIYQLDVRGAAQLIMAIDSIPDPGVEVRLPYTDLVALGDGQFALTAIGDGFLLDTKANTMSLHFCYEPDFIPEEFVQRTDAVTYDPGLDKIIAQPQTFNEDDEVVSSDVGFYDRTSGFDETWYPLNLDFAAGGMAVGSAGDLYLGEGSSLYRYNKAANQVENVADLGRFGIGAIQGLAFGNNGNLLVVDSGSDELVTIGADQLVN